LKHIHFENKYSDNNLKFNLADLLSKLGQWVQNNMMVSLMCGSSLCSIGGRVSSESVIAKVRGLGALIVKCLKAQYGHCTSIKPIFGES
jgi:hypothetical protein